jgi:hypothetical protein
VADYPAVPHRRAHGCPRLSRWPPPLAERPDHLDPALGVVARFRVTCSCWSLAYGSALPAAARPPKMATPYCARVAILTELVKRGGGPGGWDRGCVGGLRPRGAARDVGKWELLRAWARLGAEGGDHLERAWRGEALGAA